VITSKITNQRKEHFIQKILDISSQTDFQTTPQIKLLSELCRAFMSSDFENYPQIKSLFMSHIDLYDEYEKNDILLLFLTTTVLFHIRILETLYILPVPRKK